MSTFYINEMIKVANLIKNIHTKSQRSRVSFQNFVIGGTNMNPYYSFTVVILGLPVADITVHTTNTSIRSYSNMIEVNNKYTHPIYGLLAQAHCDDLLATSRKNKEWDDGLDIDTITDKEPSKLDIDYDILVEKLNIQIDKYKPFDKKGNVDPDVLQACIDSVSVDLDEDIARLESALGEPLRRVVLINRTEDEI